MPEYEIPCEFDGCVWKSVPCDAASGAKFLEAHIKAKHSPAAVEPKHTPAGPSSKSRRERPKRPEIRSEESEEDWAYIIKRWDQYKTQCELTGSEVILQLLECCSEQLRREHHRQHPAIDITSATENDVLEQLHRLSVRQQNKMVARVKLSSLTQDKGEGVRRFAGRVREIAVTGCYTVECQGCKKAVDFTTEMVKCQVVTGLAVNSHQKDVLAHPDGNTITLDKLLMFIEGKEQAERSQGLLAGSGFEAKKVEVESRVEKKKTFNCRWCGDIHQPGKANCKAADKKCESCGIMGHLKKVCRQKVDRQSTAKPVKVVDENTKQQENPVEAHWLQPNQSSNGSFYGSENKLIYLYFLVLFCSIWVMKRGKPTEIENKNVEIKTGQPTLSSKFTPNKRGLYNTILKYLELSHTERKAGSPTLGIKEANKTTWSKMEKIAGMPGHGKLSSLVSSSVLAAHHAPSPVTVCQGTGRPLSHHIYRQGCGWLRQAAKSKPMVIIRSEVDMESYTALQVMSPTCGGTTAMTERFLADTGASVCLAGVEYMGALGVRQEDLVRCDMSVRGAGSKRITVLGAVLVRISQADSSKYSKQIIYICEGVTSPLLSLEPVRILGL